MVVPIVTDTEEYSAQQRIAIISGDIQGYVDGAHDPGTLEPSQFNPPVGQQIGQFRVGIPVPKTVLHLRPPGANFAKVSWIHEDVVSTSD